MLLKSVARPQILTTGLSVAFFALMTGMSQAQDIVLTDPPESTAEETILIADPAIDDGGTACVECDGTGDEEVLIAIDPIEMSDGEPINTDGIGDGEPLVVFTDGIGDGDIVPVNIDGIGDGLPLPDATGGEDPVVTAEEFPDSNCDGCEYQDFAGGPEVQRTVTGSTHSSDRYDGLDAGAAVVSDENNICYNADLYIPLLCDWQRPFVGDKMP